MSESVGQAAFWAYCAALWPIAGAFLIHSLLREIRHRAYNTLQMIKSILHLKSDQLADPDGRRVIAEWNARIRTIAAVYKPVWDGEDRSRIGLGELVQLPVEEAFSREESFTAVELAYQLDRVSISLQPAVTVSLIIAELVSNVARHAFPAGQAGTM